MLLSLLLLLVQTVLTIFGYAQYIAVLHLGMPSIDVAAVVFKPAPVTMYTCIHFNPTTPARSECINPLN